MVVIYCLDEDANEIKRRVKRGQQNLFKTSYPRFFTICATCTSAYTNTY